MAKISFSNNDLSSNIISAIISIVLLSVAIIVMSVNLTKYVESFYEHNWSNVFCKVDAIFIDNSTMTINYKYQYDGTIYNYSEKNSVGLYPQNITIGQEIVRYIVKKYPKIAYRENTPILANLLLSVFMLLPVLFSINMLYDAVCFFYPPCSNHHEIINSTIKWLCVLLFGIFFLGMTFIVCYLELKALIFNHYIIDFCHIVILTIAIIIGITATLIAIMKLRNIYKNKYRPPNISCR